MARAYRVRASALLGMDERGVNAFNFDRAVWLFGVSVEAEMDAAEKGAGKKANESTRAAARMRALTRVLGSDHEEQAAPAASMYRQDSPQGKRVLGGGFTMKRRG